MVQVYYIALVLEPSHMQRSPSPTTESNIFYDAIILSVKSWIEVTSSYKRFDKKENLADPFAKTLGIKEFDDHK